jgi:hypothetical protein
MTEEGIILNVGPFQLPLAPFIIDIIRARTNLCGNTPAEHIS